MLEGKKVCVTGGTGFIGGALVERLVLEEKASVRALVRDFSRASRLARFELELAAGDTTDANAVFRAVQDCDVVFHCAYQFIGDSLDRSKAVNLGGTENVLRAAAETGARVVHVSTIDVYGWPQEGAIEETMPRHPEGSVYAETKVSAERVALEYHKREGVAVTVLQPTIVYGPFCGPWTSSPIKQMQQGSVVLVDGGRGSCNAVYVDDVVDALLLAATVDEAVGETFLISGPEPVTWADFYGAFESMLGSRATIDLPAETVERVLRQRQPPPPPPPESTKSEWQQLLAVLRDPSVQWRLRHAPVIGHLYRGARVLMPVGLRNRARDKFIKPRYVPQSGPSAEVAMELPKNVLIPDAWRLKVLRSRATVSSEKAGRVLGYCPAVKFERGMEMTAEYVRWANLLGTS